MKAASSEWYNTKTRHVLPDPVSSGQRLFDSNSRYAGYTSTNSSSTRRSHSLSNSNPLGSTSTSFSNRSSRSRSNSTATEPTTSTTSSTSTSTNANQYKGNRLFVPSIPETETEISETEVAFTEDDEDEEDEEDDDISSAHVPTDEASSTDQDEEEDDDDEQVYSSFKNDLRMLKVQRRQSRSPSPAVSMRSVLTDLEEDEEDLPPDEVDDEVQSTTEEEEEEEEEEEDEGMMTSASNSNSTSSSYHSSSVPKSPMKVRVKVEKSVPHDDRVKVTVLLEESEISDDEEEDEDEEDASEDTTTTAETVKYCSEDKDRTEGESYDESSEQEESESESEDELSEEENKADSRILSRAKDVGIGELTLPPVPSRIPQPQRPSIPTRSQTVHETRNESNINLKSSESKSSKSSSSGTSSRSQSARSSLMGGVSSIKKMYSVGGKPRSLSARRSVATSSSPHPPLQVQLSVESPTPPDDSPASSLKGSSSSSGQSSRLPSGDSSAVAMTKYVSLAPSGKIPLIMHHAKSLSAKSSRGSQFSAALRQLSLSNLKEGKESESEQGLPPIVSTPPSSSESNAGNKGKTKKHPLLRTNTYVISSTVSEESSTQPSNSGSIPSQSSSQLSLQKLSKLDLSERSNSLTSSANKLQWMSSTHSSSSQQSISDIISALKKAPVKDPSQVSFASEVIEHSLSTTKTNSTSQRSGSSSTSSSRASSGKKREPPRGWPANKADVIHKEIITYGELEQESIDDNETGVNEEDDKLRQHALNTIRQQMKHEMKMQTLRQKFHPTSDPEDEDSEEDDDEDDEDGEDDVELGSSSEYSEEEASIAEKKPEKTESHIPLPAETEPQSGVGGETAPHPASANQLTVPDMMTMSKDSEATKESQTSEEQPTINKSEESGWSWKDEIGTNFDDDDDDSPINSRIPSAESGYRAMPPSPASSKDNLSRQASLESEDLEKEKERLLEEWRRGGGSGAPPTITQTATSDGTTVSMKLPGMDGISPEDAFHLIKGGIDLTQDMPNEEKKIAVVWNEFNRDEQSGGAMADYEFSNLLDEMIQDTNNYKANGSNAQLNHSTSSQSLQVSNLPQSPSASPQKFHPSRKYQSFSQMVSLLSHNLRLVSSETLEDHMASLISLVSSILKKVRKNKSEDEYITQIACLSTIRVLCDRIQEMQTSQNLKYADLSWLFRILCKYSSDSDSKIRPEASFCLARLVKVAGPALVVRPIYFILVMESEGGTGKTTTGAKTKASAIDTLTYALLTFPKEEFHNLEEIAGWVCLSMLNEERRIRQSALECLAVIAEQLGGRDKALPLFRTLFLKEELDHFSRSPSPESHHTGKSGKSRKTGGKDAVPMSVHGTVRLLTGPGFPIALPIDAITARLDKKVLPVPSTKGLIEYAVNIPTGKDLVMLMTHMLDKADEEFDFSSSTDSMDSGTLNSKRSSVTSIGFSDIDWTGEGKEEKKSDENELISPDVAYILLGRGRVNKAEVLLLDVYKKEILPELLKMFEKNRGKARNRKRWGKPGQGKRKRRRKKKPKKGFMVGDGEGGKPRIPTLSFDLDRDDGDDAESIVEGEEETQEGTEETQTFPTESVSVDVDDEVFEYDDNSPTVSVIIDPPPEDTKEQSLTSKDEAKTPDQPPPPSEPVVPKSEPQPGPSPLKPSVASQPKPGPSTPKPEESKAKEPTTPEKAPSRPVSRIRGLMSVKRSFFSKS